MEQYFLVVVSSVRKMYLSYAVFGELPYLDHLFYFISFYRLKLSRQLKLLI